MIIVADVDVAFEWPLRLSLLVQWLLSTIGMVSNGAVLACLISRRHLRATQPNFLVANLIAADFLVCLAYSAWASLNAIYAMQPTIVLCMHVLAPTLFALNVHLCCSVAVVHYRSNSCLMGYSSVHGLPRLTDSKWKLAAASLSMWTFTLAGGVWAYADVGSVGAVPVCLYPVVLQNSYHVPFAMFTVCITGVIVLEHLRVLGVLAYAGYRKRPESNASIFRSTLTLLTLFVTFWTPFHYVSYLYLNPTGGVYQERYYYQAQWLCTLPLVHASLIDPFAYALCEREYSDQVVAACLSVCCPCRIWRWKLKRWKLKRFDPFYRRPPSTTETALQEVLNEKVKSIAAAVSVSVPVPVSVPREEQQEHATIITAAQPLYTVCSDVKIEMDTLDGDGDSLVGFRSSNGHVNFAYRSEYI